MYSLILLLLCFICQIVTSDALVHGRYPRFNRLNDPNVSIPATIPDLPVSHREAMACRFNGWQMASAILAMGPSTDPFQMPLRAAKGQ